MHCFWTSCAYLRWPCRSGCCDSWPVHEANQTSHGCGRVCHARNVQRLSGRSREDGFFVCSLRPNGSLILQGWGVLFTEHFARWPRGKGSCCTIESCRTAAGVQCATWQGSNMCIKPVIQLDRVRQYVAIVMQGEGHSMVTPDCINVLGILISALVLSGF